MFLIFYLYDYVSGELFWFNIFLPRGDLKVDIDAVDFNVVIFWFFGDYILVNLGVVQILFAGVYFGEFKVLSVVFVLFSCLVDFGEHIVVFFYTRGVPGISFSSDFSNSMLISVSIYFGTLLTTVYSLFTIDAAAITF